MQQVTNIQNNSFQSDPFLFPQFIFDNIVRELKPYQFINPSSKEFKLIKDLSLVNIKKSIDKYVYSDNISIRKIVLNNDTEEKILYIVFGIDLNSDLEINKKDRKNISKLLSSELDPIINVFNSRLIIFGDIIKKAILDPVVLFQDNLQDLDNGISSESSLSRYFDILGLELEYRTLKNIFKFIYSNKMISNKESIVGKFNVNDIIYNTLYLSLSKQYKNNNGICIINNVDQLFKNVVLSINIIRHLDIFEKVRFIMNNSFISDKERFNVNLNYLNLDFILNLSKITLNKNFLELSLLEKSLVIFENELEED